MNFKLAENLQLLRKQKGKTQEELAEIFGVSSQSISKWELGINCPDITMLPKIADYYRVSIDELLGYKPMSSINSIYIDVKSLIESSNNKIDDAYKIARLAVASIHDKERKQAERLLIGKRDYSLAYGQEKTGLTICSDESVFISSFVDLREYDITTIRKVANYLNKISDLNTLKVIFGLFNLHVKNKEVDSFSIDEIMEETKLDNTCVNKVLNNIDVVFNREEYDKTGVEKYTLAHLDQVPLLITLLIPSIDKYNYNIKDVD